MYNVEEEEERTILYKTQKELTKIVLLGFVKKYDFSFHTCSRKSYIIIKKIFNIYKSLF